MTHQRCAIYGRYSCHEQDSSSGISFQTKKCGEVFTAIIAEGKDR